MSFLWNIFKSVIVTQTYKYLLHTDNNSAVTYRIAENFEGSNFCGFYRYSTNREN